MRAHRRWLPILGFLLALPSPLSPQESVPGSTPGRRAVALSDGDWSRVETRLDSMRESWGIPGLAVTVVVADTVALVRGFGVRKAGEPAVVDEGTRFAIGSTTKAFTSALVATLVAEGRLGWDDRVVDHLPWFRLADPWVTRELTVRDVLAHRSGLPMANFMWLPGEATREELIRRLRHLEPAAGFRSAFTYQNVLYAAAGEVVAAATGESWAESLEARLLVPIGMTGTVPLVGGVDGLRNVARPHALVDGRPVPVPFRKVDAVAPAGSILSGAGDMAKWLRYQLAAGDPAGGAAADAALAETHAPQIPMGGSGALAAFYPRARAVSYGMGWVVSDYDGRVLLDHGGGIDGMTALVALLPSEGIGVAILANLQLPAPPYWMLYTVLDALLGLEPTDWDGRFRALTAGAGALPGPTRVEDAPPSRPLSAYAGTYTSPVLGTLRVAETEDGLGLVLGGARGRMEATLAPWHFETFRAAWRDVAWGAAAGPARVTFRADSDGRVASLVFHPLPGESWEFARAPEPEP